MPLGLNVKYISKYFIICINIDLHLKHLQNINLHLFFGSDLQGKFSWFFSLFKKNCLLTLQIPHQDISYG